MIRVDWYVEAKLITLMTTADPSSIDSHTRYSSSSQHMNTTYPCGSSHSQLLSFTYINIQTPHKYSSNNTDNINGHVLICLSYINNLTFLEHNNDTHETTLITIVYKIWYTYIDADSIDGKGVFGNRVGGDVLEELLISFVPLEAVQRRVAQGIDTF